MKLPVVKASPNCTQNLLEDVPDFEHLTGPHILTVPSSLAEASIVGSFEFQLTQFTVLVCPLSTATGFSRFECQMYTLWSVGADNKYFMIRCFKFIHKWTPNKLVTEGTYLTLFSKPGPGLRIALVSVQSLWKPGHSLVTCALKAVLKSVSKDLRYYKYLLTVAPAGGTVSRRSQDASCSKSEFACGADKKKNPIEFNFNYI